jgi:hypothetical protein
MALCAGVLPLVVLLAVAVHGAAVQVAVDLTAVAGIPPRQLRAMTREAQAIWHPHGVSLVWVASDSNVAVGLVQNTIRLVRAEGDAGEVALGTRRVRLGSVRFPDGGVLADGIVQIDVDAVARVVAAAPWIGGAVRSWPPAVRDELIGRALGRVLSHELAHYLAAWRGHTADGLLRAAFAAPALIDPDRARFALPLQVVPRLRARLAQLAQPGTSLATR